MIEIGIIIGGGIAFFKYAKENGLLPWIWAIVPALAYYGGAFITGIIIAFVAPELLNDMVILTVIALFAGAVFVGISYFIMTRVAAAKKSKISTGQSDILDQNID